MEHFTRSEDDRRNAVDQARDFFRAAAGGAPECAWPAVNLVYGCAELGEWKDAEKALRRLERLGAPWSEATGLRSHVRDRG
jgi:hypothetical protein